jgi:hypothetical protein
LGWLCHGAAFPFVRFFFGFDYRLDFPYRRVPENARELGERVWSACGG